MVNSATQGNSSNNTAHPHRKPNNSKDNGNSPHSRRLAAMCKISTSIINQLYNPIDAVNRFINLALQNIDDNSQSRQFLIESKQGIRKTSFLLKRLNNYTKKMESEISRISEAEGE